MQTEIISKKITQSSMAIGFFIARWGF